MNGILLGKNKSTNSQMNDFHKMYSFKIHLICSYSMNYWNCNIHENSIGIIGDFGTNWKRQEKLWILHDDLHKVYWIHLMKVLIQNTFIVSKLLEIWVHTLNTSHIASWFIIALRDDFADIWYIFIRNLDVSMSNYFCVYYTSDSNSTLLQVSLTFFKFAKKARSSPTMNANLNVVLQKTLFRSTKSKLLTRAYHS